MKTCLHCACDLPLSEFYRMGRYASSSCKFCQKLASRAWHVQNPERTKQSQKGWRERNPDRNRQLQKDWHLRNPEYARERAMTRIAAVKVATPSWADQGDIERWYHVAEVLSRGGVQFHVDHIVPITSKKVCGLHVQDNLSVIPKHENIAKGNHHWPDMP